MASVSKQFVSLTQYCTTVKLLQGDFLQLLYSHLFMYNFGIVFGFPINQISAFNPDKRSSKAHEATRRQHAKAILKQKRGPN